MRSSTVLIFAAMIGGIAVLTSLGLWQVKRLAWKQALIERVNDRLQQPPIPLQEILRQTGNSAAGLDYRPVSISGVFQNGKERYELTTYKGQSGWNVFVPMELPEEELIAGKELLWINRGFVPYDKKDPSTRPDSQPDGLQEFNGLLRQDLPEKPGFFVPDNNFEKGEFYWRNLSALSASIGAEPQDFAPFYVDAGIPGIDNSPEKLPQPGSTRISFPNNHLQYAVTWFGLALALLGVGSYFLYSRRSEAKDRQSS